MMRRNNTSSYRLYLSNGTSPFISFLFTLIRTRIPLPAVFFTLTVLFVLLSHLIISYERSNMALLGSIMRTELENERIAHKAAVIRAFYRPFKDIEIEAQAAIVYDIKNDKVLFHRNENLTLPLASITKVMTAYTQLLLAPELNWIRITSWDMSVEGADGLFEGETWTAKDLRDFMLVASSNVGARALGRGAGEWWLRTHGKKTDQSPESFFIEEMNRNAQSLGLRSMRFYNMSGLDLSEEQSGGYGTAGEVARLIGEVATKFPEILKATRYTDLTRTSVSGVTHHVLNTNQQVDDIAGILASKTGFTDLSGGNLAIVYEQEPGHPIAIVVLGSSIEGRFTDVKTLYMATKNAFRAYHTQLSHK